jgi:hypothetical protein
MASAAKAKHACNGAIPAGGTQAECLPTCVNSTNFVACHKLLFFLYFQVQLIALPAPIQRYKRTLSAIIAPWSTNCVPVETLNIGKTVKFGDKEVPPTVRTLPIPPFRAVPPTTTAAIEVSRN